MKKYIQQFIKIVKEKGLSIGIDKGLCFVTRKLAEKMIENAQTTDTIVNRINLARKIYYLWIVLSSDDVFLEKNPFPLPFAKEGFRGFRKDPLSYAQKIINLTKGMDSKSVEELKIYLGALGGNLVPALGKEEMKKILDIEWVKNVRKARQQGLNPEHFYQHGMAFIPEQEIVKRNPLTIIDGGAYIGDSAEVFINSQKVEKIYAFEPVSSHFNKMLSYIEEKGLFDKIVPVKKALWNKKGKVQLIFNGGASEVSEDIVEEVETISIDEFVKENKIEKIDVIKLDIEGAEYEAVEGAQETIKMHKPILLISVYHREKDLFEIKPMIEELRKDYRFKFRWLRKGYYSPFICLGEAMLLAY